MDKYTSMDTTARHVFEDSETEQPSATFVYTFMLFFGTLGKPNLFVLYQDDHWLLLYFCQTQFLILNTEQVMLFARDALADEKLFLQQAESILEENGVAHPLYKVKQFGCTAEGPSSADQYLNLDPF